MLGVCSTWIRCHLTNSEIPVVKMSGSDDRYLTDVNVYNWKGLYFGTDILPYSLIKQSQNHTFFNLLFLTICMLDQNEVKVILFIYSLFLTVFLFIATRDFRSDATGDDKVGIMTTLCIYCHTTAALIACHPRLVITSHHCMSHKCINSPAPTVPITLHSNTLIHISKYFNLLFRNPYYKCGTLQCAWPGSTQMYADTSPYRNPQDNSRVPNAQCRFVNWNLFSIVTYTK